MFDVLLLRNQALAAAADKLQAMPDWTPARAEQFRRAAVSRMNPKDYPDAEIAAKLKDWATNRGWAKGADRGKPRPPRARRAGKTAGGSGRYGDAAGEWSDTVLDHYDTATLRGMGGAGMPSGGKITDLRNAIRTLRGRGGDTRGFIVVNGDESEPSTFKDRELLLRTPHLIVEGVIIAGLLSDATQGFIYIRHEYTEQIEACRAAIARAESLGLCGREATALGRPFRWRSSRAPVDIYAASRAR